MKRQILGLGIVGFLAVAFMAPGSAFGSGAEWEWMNPLPQGNILRSVWGSSATDVFAVGDGGAIVHYDGTSWSVMSSGTTQYLTSVWGSSPTDVFAVGWTGTILHYNGTGWSAMSSGTTQYLTSVWGSSPTDVFAVGWAGTILHYNGTGWSAMSSGTTQDLRGVWGSSPTDVFAVGWAGTILHYDGTGWSAMSSGTTDWILGVWGSSSTDVFAVGWNGAIHHYDGTSWSPMISNSWRYLYNVWGSSSTDVFAVGDEGTILHYDGTNWSALSSGTTSYLYGVWGSSATDIFIAGDWGYMFHYDGATWSPMSSGATHHLQDVWGSSSTHVYAVGYSGTILHHDGTSWSAMSSGTTEQLNGVWGSSAVDVFAVGEKGAILRYNGTSWSGMTSGTTQSLQGVWGSSATDVFAVGKSGTILHYNGTDWTAMSSGTAEGLYGVWGSSATDVFAVGDIGTILHYDGTSWSAMSNGTTHYFRSVWGSSSTDVFAVGYPGTILHYDGTSWSAMPGGVPQFLQSVWGRSSRDVFAVGYSGTILHYNGTSWSTMSSGMAHDLYGVWRSSETDVYAVGDGGAILHYSPPVVAPTVTTNAATGITSGSATLNMSYTMGSYDALRVCFSYKKASDSEWTETGWAAKSAPGDHSEAITGLDSDTLYDFMAQLLYLSTILDGDTLQFTTSSVALPPAIGLSRNNLHFGHEIGGTPPGAQQVLITNTGGGTLDWTAASGAAWLGVTPGSGTGDSMIAVSVDATGLAAGTYTSQVTIAAAGATNSPQKIDVTLNVIAAGASSPPFGFFDTPTAGATVAGAIPVTGWALDDVEVVKVDVKRSPHATDNPAAIGPDGLVYIGDAIFVEGARPDIEAAYPDYPLNYRAGWGYMLLTNMLPGGGNGPFTLHAFATDKDGNRVKLGEKAITSDNANSKLPFGTIDTPSQGGGASGSAYDNFGWALTPKPNMIPTDGSTIWVFVDGVPLGNPSYNHYRDDIATLFPDYLNSGGAVGVYDLNTKAYANGLHTIAWGVTDNAGNADGIGSRYFMVQNMRRAEIEEAAASTGPYGMRRPLSEIAAVPTAFREPVFVSKGYDMAGRPEPVAVGADGTADIRIAEVERVELVLGVEVMERAVSSGRWSGRGAGAQPPASAHMQPDLSVSGYLAVGDELRPLPIGSTLDPASGIFAWQPGPGFLGEYTFVFVRERRGGLQDKSVVRITIEPKF